MCGSETLAIVCTVSSAQPQTPTRWMGRAGRQGETEGLALVGPSFIDWPPHIARGEGPISRVSLTSPLFFVLPDYGESSKLEWVWSCVHERFVLVLWCTCMWNVQPVPRLQWWEWRGVCVWWYWQESGRGMLVRHSCTLCMQRVSPVILQHICWCGIYTCMCGVYAACVFAHEFQCSFAALRGLGACVWSCHTYFPSFSLLG